MSTYVTIANVNTSLNLYRVLNFEEYKRDPIAIKGPLGNPTPISESDAYRDLPLEYIIRARLTSTERTTLKDIQDDILIVQLSLNGVAVDVCWIQNIEGMEISEEHASSHWVMTIYLIKYVIAPLQRLTNRGFETGDLTGWTLVVPPYLILTTDPYVGTYHGGPFYNYTTGQYYPYTIEQEIFPPVLVDSVLECQLYRKYGQLVPNKDYFQIEYTDTTTTTLALAGTPVVYTLENILPLLTAGKYIKYFRIYRTANDLNTLWLDQCSLIA